MWAVYSVVWRGGVGTRSHMCHGGGGVHVWGKCCCMYMKLVIGRYVVSYYVCVCGAIMYIINVSHVYVLVYTIPGYGNYSMDIN